MPKDQQKKRRKKQSTVHKQSDVPWKAVDVSLLNDGEEEQLDELKNHYDDPKLQRKGNRELEAEPGEDVAMFYGLEVLDTSEYQVVGTGSDRHVIVKKSTDGGGNQESDPDPTQSKKKKTKQKEEQTKSQEEKDDKASGSKKSNKKETEKKSKKKRKRDDDDKTKDKTNTTEEKEEFNPSSEEIIAIQTKWSSATGGVVLQDRLCRSLIKLGYNEPTPIQASTLSASVLGRRNLVGAAPTGSGKTLAFLLPILQHLVELDVAKKESGGDERDDRRVEALILTPTRELAQQICAESERMMPKECVSLTGGIAIVKQIRLLQSRPRIIVATPGRLWAMVRKLIALESSICCRDSVDEDEIRNITESKNEDISVICTSV